MVDPIKSWKMYDYCPPISMRNYFFSSKQWDCSTGVMPPITTSATFVMSGPEENPNEHLYGRYGNPSRNSVESILASLEGAKHALCFSSGMSLCVSLFLKFPRVFLFP